MRSFLRLDRVVHRVAGIERARVDAEERERADERIGHDLERERGERLRRRRPCGWLRCSSSSMPATGGRSDGDGSNWTTASSIACTPLFLKAVPQ